MCYLVDKVNHEEIKQNEKVVKRYPLSVTSPKQNKTRLSGGRRLLCTSVHIYHYKDNFKTYFMIEILKTMPTLIFFIMLSEHVDEFNDFYWYLLLPNVNILAKHMHLHIKIGWPFCRLGYRKNIIFHLLFLQIFFMDNTSLLGSCLSYQRLIPGATRALFPLTATWCWVPMRQLYLLT